jgi:hypothetical protein
MTRYYKLTNSELDSLLLLAYLPKRIDKINLFNKDELVEQVLYRLAELDLKDEFSDNIAFFLLPKIISKNSYPPSIIHDVIMCDIRIYKMAALKTFDENREYIKL